jgi:hypothetical protein
MDTGTAALLATVIGTGIGTSLFQYFREGRQRKWDQEDRAALALKVVTVAKAVSDKVETENAKLADAIQIGHDKADQLTVATAKIEEQTNGGFTHLREKLSDAEGLITDMRREITSLKSEVVKVTKGA